MLTEGPGGERRETEERPDGLFGALSFRRNLRPAPVSVISMPTVERLADVGTWLALGGAAGYLAYHFVLIGHQYLRVAVAL